MTLCFVLVIIDYIKKGRFASLNITYRELDENDYDTIKDVFGDIIKKYNLPYFREKSFTYGAFDGQKLVGVISVVVLPLLSPLVGEEAFINYVGVLSDYRRQGIGSCLMEMAEKWTKGRELFQLRGWSSTYTVEAIMMANKLKYALAHSIIYDVDAPLDDKDKFIIGYNWVKRFD